MANNSADLDNATNEIRAFDDAIANDANNISISERAKRASTKADRDYAEAQEKLRQTVEKSLSSITRFAQSISKGNDSFEPLNKAIDLITGVTGALAGGIPLVGEVAKEIAKTAGEAAKFIVDTFSKTYQQFEKLSDSGIVTTFMDLEKAGASLELTYADVGKVLTSHSKQIAIFGGSAEAGREQLQNVAMYANASRKEMKRLGISAADFTETMANYMAIQNRFQPGIKLDAEATAKGAVEYAQQIDTLSKMTGVSRKELEQKMLDLTRNARFLAGTMNLSEKARGNISTFVADLSAMNQDFGKGVMELMSTPGGNPGKSKDAQAAWLSLSQAGIDVADFVDKMRTGVYTYDQGMDIIGEAYRKNAGANDEIVGKIGANSLVYKNYVTEQDIAAKTVGGYAKQRAKIIAAQQDNMTNTTSTNSRLADTSTHLYETAQRFEKLATSSNLAKMAMDKLSAGIDHMTGLLYDAAGVKQPEHLKERQEELDLIKKINVLRLENAKSRNEALEMAKRGEKTAVADQEERQKIREKEIAAAEAALETQRLKRIEADKRAGILESGPGSAVPSEGPPNSNATANPNEAGVKPEVLQKKAQLEAILGKKLVVTSGYRAGTQNHGSGSAIDLGLGTNKLSQNEINTIFKAAIDLGFTGIGAEFSARGGAHIHLDTSHSTLVGWGSDERSSSLATDSPYLAQLINERRQGVPKARTGGIFSGPDSGYPIELHDTEAMINLDGDGVTQRSLNTSDLPSNDEEEQMMIKILAMVTDKLSRVTTIVSDGTFLQKSKLMFNG